VAEVDGVALARQILLTQPRSDHLDQHDDGDQQAQHAHDVDEERQVPLETLTCSSTLSSPRRVKKKTKSAESLVSAWLVQLWTAW
jgi:hypothetical protein